MKSRFWISLTLLTILSLLSAPAIANPAGPVDPWEKEPAAGESAEVQLLPVGELNDLSGQSNAAGAFPAALTGQTFEKETEPNNSAADADVLSNLNTVVLGNIYPTADEDYFSFTASAGNRVFAAAMTSFSASASTDSYLEILDAGGGVLEFDTDDGSFGSLSSSIAGAVIPANGTYYLHVRHQATGQIRPYHLHFRLQSGLPAAELEPNNSPATATPLPLAGWVAGSIGTANDADYYSLNLNAGETVFLSLDLDPERDAVTWNGRVGFGVFAGYILVANDVSTTSPNSEAFFYTVKESGQYYILVDPATLGAGDPTYTYHLSVSVHPAEVAAGSCTTYTNNTPLAITDVGVTTSVISVPAGVRVADLDVDFNITHSNMIDLDVVLQAPGGNQVGLFTDVGSSFTTNLDIRLDDEAALPAGLFNVLAGAHLQPELNSRLGWFDGQAGGGDWTLSIYDDLAGNLGTLNSWSLTICEPLPAPACPAGSTPVVLYSSDFEVDGGGFTHSGTLDEWERGLPVFAPITSCNSGSNCWVTDLDDTYNASSSQDLRSPAIDLTDPLLVGPVMLSWAQKFQLESASFDHAYVDAQLAGGGSATRLWEWLDATMSTSVGVTPLALQQSAGWGAYTRDISSYLGQSIEVLFHLDSDTTVQFAGLAVDDVQVTGCVLNSNPAVELDITVGTDPQVCATTDSVTLPITGGVVTYCFEITNTGDVVLDRHTLVDDQLGTILADFPYALAPSASAFITSTLLITEPTINTATWTAYLNGALVPTSATDSDTAQVFLELNLFMPLITRP